MINTNFHIKQPPRRLIRGLSPWGTSRMVISLYGPPVCAVNDFPADSRDAGGPIWGTVARIRGGGVKLEIRKVPKGACRRRRRQCRRYYVTASNEPHNLSTSILFTRSLL